MDCGGEERLGHARVCPKDLDLDWQRFGCIYRGESEASEMSRIQCSDQRAFITVQYVRA